MNSTVQNGIETHTVEFDEDGAGQVRETLARDLSAGVLFPEEARHAIRILRRLR